MVMTLEPPGRTSSSALGVVKGAGVNHCVMSAGSVQARKTFSGGASMMALRMRSRPSRRVVGWVAVVGMGVAPFGVGDSCGRGWRLKAKANHREHRETRGRGARAAAPDHEGSHTGWYVSRGEPVEKVSFYCCPQGQLRADPCRCGLGAVESQESLEAFAEFVGVAAGEIAFEFAVGSLPDGNCLGEQILSPDGEREPAGAPVGGIGSDCPEAAALE